MAKVLTLPAGAFLSLPPVNFVQLTLEDASGETIDENFYWLSTKRNVYDWANTDAYTAISSYENLTELQSLPSAGRMDVSAAIGRSGEDPHLRVKVRNPSDHLAFQIHLGVRHKGEDAEILPGCGRTTTSS